MDSKALRIRLCPQATQVSFPRPDGFEVELADGRSISVPLGWFPRLLRAKPAQLRRVEILGQGSVLRWPDVDEDILVAGLLATDAIAVWPDTDMRLDRATPSNRARS